MGLLGSIANLGGATSLRLLGAVQLPGSESRARAFGIANNITNPNVNIAGKVNNPTPLVFGHESGATPLNAGEAVAQPSGSYVGGGGGSSTSATSAAQAAANTQAIGIANAALGRLPNQLDIALGNINGQYGQKANELDSSLAQNKASYDTSTNQNQQDRVNNLNTIDSQASSGLRGLLRILGQHGAGGSSAAQYAAPNAVGNVATQQRSGAGQTFGQNQQSLDTNWNNFATGIDNSKRQLDDWRNSQVNSARATSDQNKAGLLQTLAGLQKSSGAAQPYIDQINSLSSEIDNLGRLSPTYTGNTPVYTAPDLSTYAVGDAVTPELSAQGGPGASTPWLQMLLGQRDKQQNQFGF